MTTPVTIERNGVTCKLHNCDCLPFMRELPDKAFNLAICDPPWGINAGEKKQYHAGALTSYTPKVWDDCAPGADWFFEIRRVSKEQIIWGANYFTEFLPPAKNWIVWDKLQPKGVSFSMHELAYYSGSGQAMIYRGYNGANRVANNDEKAQKYIRIHPTQKPVALYSWLLANYAKPGQTILDTHGGSMSSVLACVRAGFYITCCELDADYFKAGVDRVQRELAQMTFDLKPEPEKAIPIPELFETQPARI